MKCLNQICPFNKEKRCNDDVVISGKSYCHGKNVETSKIKKLSYRELWDRKVHSKSKLN